MGRILFAPASEFSIEQVTQAFNRAFTGYYLPMTQTPAGLAEMMRENDVQLGVSLTLLVDGALEGIGLVALRGERGWIASMGIGPRLRGRWLGRQLLARLLDAMRGAGARTAQLEALTVNLPALALYTSMGFQDVRELRVYQGPLRMRASVVPASGMASAQHIRPLAPRVALLDFAAFHQTPPAWQREERTLSQMRRISSGLGLWEGERLRAYTLYAHQQGGLVIFDAGSSDPSPDARRAHIVTLLTYLMAGREDLVARAINTPPGDAMGDALDWLACPVVARQREMARTLYNLSI